MKKDVAEAETVETARSGTGTSAQAKVPLAGNVRNPLSQRKRRTAFGPQASTTKTGQSIAAAAAAGRPAVSSLKGLRRGSRSHSRLIPVESSPAPDLLGVAVDGEAE